MSPIESGGSNHPRFTVIYTPRQRAAQPDKEKVRKKLIRDLENAYEENDYASVDAEKFADMTIRPMAIPDEVRVYPPHRGQTECIIVDYTDERDHCIIKLPRHIASNAALQKGRDVRRNIPSLMFPICFDAIEGKNIITFHDDPAEKDTIVSEEYIPHTTTLADHTDKLLLVPTRYADSFILNSIDLFEKLLQSGIVLIDNRPQNIAVVESEDSLATQFVYFDLGGLRDFTPTILIRNLCTFAACIEHIERTAETSYPDADLPECREIARQLRTFREQSLLPTIEKIRQQPYRQQIPALVEFPREHYTRMLIQLGDEYRAMRRASNIPLQRETPHPRAAHNITDRLAIHVERFVGRIRRTLTKTA